MQGEGGGRAVAELTSPSAVLQAPARELKQQTNHRTKNTSILNFPSLAFLTFHQIWSQKN
jgi:hypothetical protein